MSIVPPVSYSSALMHPVKSTGFRSVAVSKAAIVNATKRRSEDAMTHSNETMYLKITQVVFRHTVSLFSAAERTKGPAHG